jgi:O-antigen ligase
VLAVTGLREKIMLAIPLPIKQAIGVGIGLFIAFIGLVNGGFVSSTLMPAPPVELGGTGSLAGWPVLVFCIGLIAVIVLYTLAPEMRRALLAAVVIAMAVLPLYTYAMWNNTSLIAMPAQSVKSAFAPDNRDEASNDYRDIENTNLRATVQESPLTGIGFGLPMTQVELLPDISDGYTWYLHLPHNSFLWLAMTAGLLGIAAISYLMVSAVTKTVAAIRDTWQEPYLRALFVLVLLAIGSFLMFALYDQGLMSERLGTFVGILLGLVALAPRFLPLMKEAAPRTASMS